MDTLLGALGQKLGDANFWSRISSNRFTRNVFQRYATYRTGVEEALSEGIDEVWIRG
jgi:hypothetical protein